MIKTDNNLLKKAPKRFTYPVEAFIEVNKSRQPIQIQNISKTGIQFFSPVSISNQAQIRLMWEDPHLGAMESYLLIVRTIELHDQSTYPHCYGSKFVHLKDEVRKNVNRVVEITEEHERKNHEKWFDNGSFKTINDIIFHGRAYLRDNLRGTKSLGVIDQFSKELKSYEKQSFENNDEQSQWLQKIVTQYFHSRILLVVLSSSVKMSDIRKLITDKLQSMDGLIAECEKFMTSKGITKKSSGGLYESLNRLIFGRLELLEIFNKRCNREALNPKLR